MKRLLDIIVSAIGLLLFSPVLLVFFFLVWIYDFHSPLYKANRVGIDGKLFRMIKIRSMVVNADKSGVDSTSSSDSRITPVGRLVRKYKLDEVTQLWNVLKGDMSLVGPRPQVKRDVDLYTDEENKLLTIKPGITDFSSIVFSDEGEILKDKPDPDLAYNQLIRPWKSRLGILYIDNRNLLLDLKLIAITLIAIISKNNALKHIQNIVRKLDAEDAILHAISRTEELKPTPPPGQPNIVLSRPVIN